MLRVPGGDGHTPLPCWLLIRLNPTKSDQIRPTIFPYPTIPFASNCTQLLPVAASCNKNSFLSPRFRTLSPYLNHVTHVTLLTYVTHSATPTSERASLTGPKSVFYDDCDLGTVPPALALACRPDPSRCGGPAGLELPCRPSRPCSLDVSPFERPRISRPPDLPPRTALVRPTHPSRRKPFRDRRR